MEAATATPPRMTADNVGNTTRSKRRDRTRQFFSPFCNDFRPARGTGWGLAGELPLCGAVPLPAAPFGKWARLAGASKDAVGTCAGDRGSVSRAGLPVISRLDRTVLHLSPGERQASTEPRGCRAKPKHRHFPAGHSAHDRLSRVWGSLSRLAASPTSSVTTVI